MLARIEEGQKVVISGVAGSIPVSFAVRAAWRREASLYAEQYKVEVEAVEFKVIFNTE